MSNQVSSRFKLIIAEEVQQLTGWSKSTLERKLAAGEFPNPVEGNKRGQTRRWTLAQYEAWAKRKMDAADEAA